MSISDVQPVAGGAALDLNRPERRLWQLGWPVALQALFAAALGLVDTIMVAGVSPAALGGVGLVGRFYFVVTLVLVGLSGAVAALSAVEYGAGRPARARAFGLLGAAGGVAAMLPVALLSLAMPLTVGGWLSRDEDVAGAAATFLQWSGFYAPLTVLTLTLSAELRSSGNTRLPLVAGVVSLIINTLLNFLFIAGNCGMPAFGVAAAGAATMAARLVEAAILWREIRIGRSDLALLCQGRDVARRLLAMSLPLMGKELAWSSGVFAAAIFIGRLGTLPLAAYNLILPIEGILGCAVHGLAVACGILIGHTLGRGQPALAQTLARRLLGRVSLGAGIAGVLAAGVTLFLMWSGCLQSWFSNGLHDLSLSALAVTFAFYGARAHNTMVSVGILRAGGDVKWLMWVDLASMWLVNVPLVALAVSLHWPLAAVVALMLGEEVVKVTLFRRRVWTGRWRRLGV